MRLAQSGIDGGPPRGRLLGCELHRFALSWFSIRLPSSLCWCIEQWVVAHKAHNDNTDFVQPGTMHREEMSETDREHLLT
jgi:hypothetical protein